MATTTPAKITPSTFRDATPSQASAMAKAAVKDASAKAKKRADSKIEDAEAQVAQAKTDSKIAGATGLAAGVASDAGMEVLVQKVPAAAKYEGLMSAGVGGLAAVGGALTDGALSGGLFGLAQMGISRAVRRGIQKSMA